jgi:hypothetical protein
MVMVTSSVLIAPAVSADGHDYITGVSTDYNTETGSQDVGVTLTIEPTDSKVTDLEVDISDSSEALVDEESFQYTVKPSDSDIQVDSEGGTYNINEVNPGESVTIEFVAYPSTLGDGEIAASEINLDYVMNGQEIEEQLTTVADISENPWLAQQDTEQAESLNNSLLTAVAVFATVSIASVWHIHSNTVKKSSIQGLIQDAKRTADKGTVERKLEEVQRKIGGEAETGLDGISGSGKGMAGIETDGAEEFELDDV